MSGTPEQFAGNLDYWEQAAATHGTTDTDIHYHFDEVVAGGTLMTALEARGLADATGASYDAPLANLAGLDVLYLQSHLGADAITMARAGARVTCADFSATALRRVRELAERCGVDVETVETDSRAIPESLYGRFDVVYVTVGAICWIDDLDRWMRQVALALRAGGHLAMIEIHPILQMFDARLPDLVCDFPYGGGGHFTTTDTGTYADPESTISSTTTSYAHSIADVVMGARRAGLSTELLQEHVDIEINPRGDDLLQQGDDGLWRLLVGRGTKPGDPPHPLPVYFTYVAVKE